MPVQVTIEFTPIRAPRGKLVHATSFTRPGRTLCGIRHSGWLVVTGKLECPGCKAAALKASLG